ncbi:DNA polymerase [Cloacibacillus sp. An23]|uniref:DNA polymerase n=1 Tax=Cloacibacillus sp. An23 TaxID=1965591 RepID=UPI000B3A3E68|nr:DNA polymerase [Cloacibacillus sp. An23]OUO94664.1 hypothetical protein B5F39_01970 [Cloacibacillus sp. An23]
MKKDLLLIDGHGLAFRAFYALPQELSAPDGTPTNAILGFFNMMLKVLDEWPVEGLGIFFDPKGPTRRHELFAEYKQTRKPTPESFKAQMPLIIDLCRAMGFPVFSRDGVEADDYIVSTAKACAASGWDVKILSADKDLFQAIGSGVSVIRPSRGVTDFGLYDEESFREKYGFEPPLMADYLALVGDTADNIPGVSGIGEKTALDLVGKFGRLENIYENLESVPKARRGKLEAGRDAAFMSRVLVVPQETEPASEDELIPKGPEMNELFALCSRLGLKKIFSRFGDEPETPKTEAAAAPSAGAQEEAELASLLEAGELAVTPAGPDGGSLFFAAAADGRLARLDLNAESDRAVFEEWTKRGRLLLCGLRETLSAYPGFPLPERGKIYDVEAAHYLLHPDRAGAAGMARTFGEPELSGARLAPRLFAYRDALGPGIEKYGLAKVMEEIDMPLAPVLAKMHLAGIRADTKMLEDLGGKLSASIEETEAAIKDYVGAEINLSSPKQVSELLFGKLMLPPLKTTKSGGAYSTSIVVLEELARLPEPMCAVPKMLIKLREESKIYTAFVQPFIKYSRDGGGVIHSTFDHLATGTGRLASRDPNVQNMPVFHEWADKFRSCFKPRRDDGVFVAADYSQIELRVLAELAGEEKLIQAFSDGRDIHLETASWVFGLPAGEITGEQRRFAKVVNFGLLYGMSAFGLAQRLGVPRPTAQQIVDRYFSVLPRVKGYITESVAEAKERGYTRSLFGRIRPLAEVSTAEGRGSSALNRIAVNTPIQSAAADIAKIALFRFDAALAEKFPDARIVLQVHDSIVCECAERDKEAVKELLVGTMEGVRAMSVPLKAEPKIGKSLSEL